MWKGLKSSLGESEISGSHPRFSGNQCKVHEKCLVDKCLFLRRGSLYGLGYGLIAGKQEHVQAQVWEQQISPDTLSYSTLTLFSQGVLACRTLSNLPKGPLKGCPWMPPSVIVTPLICAESCWTTATPSGICTVLVFGLQQIWQLCWCCSAPSHLSHGYTEVISNQLFKSVCHSVFPRQEYTNLEKI